MNPEFDDEKPINPFDFWEGANFKLKIRNVEGYRNYDKSEFDSPSALAEDDELEAIWNKQSSLVEFLDPKNFKTYDELKAKLQSVLTSAGSSVVRAEETNLEEERPVRTTPKVAPKREEHFDDNDDESLSYFAKLANED